MLMGACSLAALLTFTINWLALFPWRRAEDQHWTERARLLHPVRSVAAVNLWVLPVILTIAALLLWPNKSPHWMLMVFATAFGTVGGTVPLDHEVFPRASLSELLRLVAIGWLIRFALWFVFLSAIALSPEKLNAWSFAVVAAVLALVIFWNNKGWIWTGRKLGLFLPPPENLKRIVQDTAAGMQVSVRELWLMRSLGAQAMAMPATRTVFFTERTLQILSENEIAAICAHELAHLAEAKTDYYKRYIQWLMFLPWLLVKPVVHVCGPLGIAILLLATSVVPRLYRSISHKLELRADQKAKAEERDPGIYAQALARLYEDNLLPAVTAKRGTHPHLYDRLVAAGMTPDFPRPAAASSTTWYGYLLGGLMGLLAALLVGNYFKP